MKQIFSMLTVLSAVTLLSGRSLAQDAAKVDPKHYKVEFENDKVRVLRASYAPGEKSVMHGHPDAVAVLLNDMKGNFTFPDGTSEERTGKAGQVLWTPATKHMPANSGDQPYEVILVELKTKPSKTK